MTTDLASIDPRTKSAWNKSFGHVHVTRKQWIDAGLIALGLLWAYWPIFTKVIERWTYEPQYSHGYFVPVFAVFLLWHRREHCPETFHSDARGLVLVAAAGALVLFGSFFHFGWFEAASLIPCLAGLCLLWGGWKALAWAWPAILYLLFMVPLPFRAEVSLARPLQSLATEASTIALIMLGFPATADGNIISLYDGKIGVAEACGGLSMLLTFFALATAFALAIHRPILDKAVIMVSAIPIALFANVVRIAITGVLYETVGSQAARVFFHDLAGWFMMAIALGMFWFVLQVTSRLFLETALEEEGPLPILGGSK